ncbi:MAG: hypothetical protein E6H98_01565 [Chloroflexi bacterium]|nr:MAG: hypothetical protein E6H98_01565 [Chloroflexota bacterium]
MRRSILHLTAVLVAIGALSSALGSAAPPYQAGASEPPTLTAAVPEITLGPRPDRVPVSTPTPVPSPVRTVTPLPTRMPRPAATLRPLPVPVIAAQEVTLVNLDTGRFLWQSNARAARAPASLTKIFTAMVAVDLIGMNTTVTVPASITQLPADWRAAHRARAPLRRLPQLRQRRRGNARRIGHVPVDVHCRHEYQGGPPGPARHALH